MTDARFPDDPRLAAYGMLSDHAALCRAGLFVAEGRLVVRRLLEGRRFRVHSVVVTPVARRALEDVLTSHQDRAPLFVVPQQWMTEIAGFNFHRGCLALAERPVVPLLTPEQVTRARRVLLFEGVNNPDNVGGLFRSAAAFGVDLVVLGPACSDPLYRKAIRTSMAATLHVPFVLAAEWPGAIDVLHASGWTVVAMTPSADALPLDDVPQSNARLALLVGAEGEGLSAPARARADYAVRVEMAPGVDSLNVTVAASIALHHFQVR